MPVVDPALPLLLRGTLATIFLLSAIQKIRNTDHFRGVLANYRLLPEPLITPTASLLGPVEAALALGLLSPSTAALAAIILAGLCFLYTAAIAINLARGRIDIDCGCAGPSAANQKISTALLWRNTCLIAAMLLVIAPTQVRPWVSFDLVLIGLGSLALTGLYVASNQLIANRDGIPSLRVNHG